MHARACNAKFVSALWHCTQSRIKKSPAEQTKNVNYRPEKVSEDDFLLSLAPPLEDEAEAGTTLPVARSLGACGNACEFVFWCEAQHRIQGDCHEHCSVIFLRLLLSLHILTLLWLA